MIRFANLSSALLGATRTGLKSGESLEDNVETASEPVADNDVLGAMTCTRTDSATECSLAIAGSLDVHSAPEIRVVFDSVVAARLPLVVLHLDGLTMLDSSGVGAIVSLFKRVKATGGCVVLKGVQNQPLAVCKLLKLDRVFGL
jgi:anti-sigma B factor antagonist